MAEVLVRFETATNTKVSIANTTTVALAAGPGRQFARFTNDSDEVIYLGLGAAAVLNEGVRLTAAGGVFEINGTNIFTGAVNAISTSGSKNLCVSYHQ